MADWKSISALLAFGAAASMLMTTNPFSLAFYPIGFAQSAIEPLSEEESGEIDFLNCLEQSASDLEDGTIVDVQVSDQVFDGGSVSYLAQRLDEILYPRLRITDQAAEIVMQIKHETEVPIGPVAANDSDGMLLNQLKCSNVLIEFREVD